MVLVDTSVWIRFLYNKRPFAQALQDLLRQDDVLGHALVYGELLIGASDGRKGLLSAYSKISQSVALEHDEVVRFVVENQLFGKGIGWVDAHLLASAVRERARLWTTDSHLLALAVTFGIAFHHV